MCAYLFYFIFLFSFLYRVRAQTFMVMKFFLAEYKNQKAKIINFTFSFFLSRKTNKNLKFRFIFNQKHNNNLFFICSLFREENLAVDLSQTKRIKLKKKSEEIKTQKHQHHAYI